MPSSLKLDPHHNEEIRAEIGERLRIVLSGEQPPLPSAVQRLLDRLSKLDNLSCLPRRPRAAQLR